MNKTLPNTLRLPALLLLLLAMAGCATNPVTGKRELHLVSEAQEIQIGKQNYLPSRQSQGGAYRLDPDLTRYVSQVGQKLARVSDRPDLPYEFVVLNNSVPNAWALPGGKIAVNRGLLLELGSEAELAAVLGHEIVHAAARHGARSMERGMLLQMGVIATRMAVAGEKYANLIVGAAGIGAQLINTKYGRDAELESDRYGMKYMLRAGYDPRAAVTLQETFVRLSKGRTPGWLEGLFASHPPSQERVEANRRYAATAPAGLRVGREEYQLRIAGLKATSQAYADYDAGREALARGDAQKALALADRAIGAEEREALFWGLRGEALLKLGKKRQAKTMFDRALQRNPDFFAFYLQRGIIEQELGDSAQAKADLERSLELLPTATAHYALANLALEQRNEREAIGHLRMAAGSPSPLGQQAARELALLELPREPGKYLAVRGAWDGEGGLVVQIGNRSPIAVTGILLGLRNRYGWARKIPIREAIPAGKSITIRLPEPGSEVHLEILRARPLLR
ncbi:MAG TPA: tetratricopeptide repeat protein [Gammaproteobacteria bacterium]|nr:tetratricopeptide repeat protein [Gammaproteobacteria bacterium]